MYLKTVCRQLPSVSQTITATDRRSVTVIACDIFNSCDMPATHIRICRNAPQIARLPSRRYVAGLTTSYVNQVLVLNG